MEYCSLGRNLCRKEGRLCAGESEAEIKEMLENRTFYFGGKKAEKSEMCEPGIYILKLRQNNHVRDPVVAQRETSVLEGGEWSAARPGRTLPPGKSRYPP